MDNTPTAISKPTLDVVVGLGSNLPFEGLSSRMLLGRAVSTLQQTVSEQGKVRVSRLYQSAPLGPKQPNYLNAALRLNYNDSAISLLDELQMVENRFGRVRQEHWGPRTLDLDILYIAGMKINTERLQVPHPELQKRCFAFLPMMEVLGLTNQSEGPENLVPEFSAVEADQMLQIDSESWWKTLSHK